MSHDPPVVLLMREEDIHLDRIRGRFVPAAARCSVLKMSPEIREPPRRELNGKSGKLATLALAPVRRQREVPFKIKEKMMCSVNRVEYQQSDTSFYEIDI